MKTYKVTMTKQFPAWDERDGLIFTVTATSKMQAIKYARQEAADGGHCGRASFKAIECEAETDDDEEFRAWQREQFFI